MSKTSAYWSGEVRETRLLDRIIAAAQTAASSSEAEHFATVVLKEMRARRRELALDEGTYEMANIRPEKSGLPFIVYISEKGNARHAARVKVATAPRAAEFVASVSVEPEVAIMAGNLSPGDLALLKKWIDLNREPIMGYWNGDIQYTEDVLQQLKRLPD